MAQHSLSDRVAIVSMACTPFGEHFDRSVDDLAVEAVTEALAGAGLTTDDVDAYWVGTYISGISGMSLSRPLRLEGKPVTRVENMCATGSEALRAAVYAVASGAVDIAMAVGVEKLKDTGYAGLISPKIQDDGTRVNSSAPANFSLLAPAYEERYGVAADGLPPGDDPRGLEEPRQRCAEPARPVPQGGVEGGDRAVTAGRRHVGRARLLRGGRRSGRGDRGAGRGRAPLHRPAAVHQGARAGHRKWVGRRRRVVRLHHLPGGRRVRPGGVCPGRHHRSAPGAGTGRGARLLHADRDRADGGPGVLRAGQGLARRAGRALRPRRRAAGQPRRRAQELRPPGRGERVADDLRMLAATARRGRRAPDRYDRSRPGAHAEPRRRAGRLRLFHRGRRSSAAAPGGWTTTTSERGSASEPGRVRRHLPVRAPPPGGGGRRVRPRRARSGARPTSTSATTPTVPGGTFPVNPGVPDGARRSGVPDRLGDPG